MKAFQVSICKLMITAVLAIATLTATYVWLIPRLFPTIRTYWVLVVVLCAAAVFGGYFGYTGPWSPANRLLRLATGAAIGVMTAVVVGLISMFAIVNLKGS